MAPSSAWLPFTPTPGLELAKEKYTLLLKTHVTQHSYAYSKHPYFSTNSSQALIAGTVLGAGKQQ